MAAGTVFFVEYFDRLWMSGVCYERALHKIV